MVLNLLKKLLFIVVWMVLIFDLTLAYYYFINAYWIEMFVENPLILVHSWGVSDTIGTFLIIIVSFGVYWLAYKTWFPKMKPNNLTTFRKSITVITVFVSLCNILFMFIILLTEHFRKHWNIGEWIEREGIFLTVAYFTGEILILLILIAFQIGLSHLTYRAWVSKSQENDTLITPLSPAPPTPTA